jgi:hypothetical protein
MGFRIEDLKILIISGKTHLPSFFYHKLKMLSKFLLVCSLVSVYSQDGGMVVTTEPMEDATGAPALDTTQSDSALAGAKAVINNVRSNGQALMMKEVSLCKEEFDGVNEWQETIEGNAAERAANKAKRNADKAALGAAVAGRLASLNKFLAFLKTIRQQLGEHIQRTNKVFQSVYDANEQCVMEASKVMQDLGYVVSLPWSPFVTPIIVPKQDKLDAEAAADTDPSDDIGATGNEAGAATGAAEDSATGSAADVQEKVPAASLMELESSMMTQVSYCKDMDSCKLPYTQAFKLYKVGYGHAKQNKAFFEKERAALGGFRDGLKEIIKNKESKRAALEKQQAEIAAKLANPPPGLDALFPFIDKHEEIVHKGCSEMKARSEKALKELADIETIFDSKGCVTCGDQPAATGASDEVAAEEPVPASV